MAVFKRGGATRKLGSVGIGRKIVRFGFEENKRHYTVHEDLLCAHSKLFKRRLQRLRKPLQDECSICTEPLDSNVEDITFCRSGCGQNFHEQSIDEWRASQPGQTMCPMCRKIWKSDTNKLQAVDVEVNQCAIQLYVEWLYSGQLQEIEGVDDVYDDWNINLLHAWKVADTMEDEDFKRAIIAEIIAKRSPMENTGFWLASAVFAFEEQCIDEMQEFVAEAFLIDIDEHWFKESSREFPDDFVHAVGCAAICAIGDEITHEKLLKKYTKGEYTMVIEDNE